MRLAVILLLAAVGFLVAALRAGHAGLAWVSVGLSAVAAAMILWRWRRSWQLQDSPDDQLVLSADESITDFETGEITRAPASVTAVGYTEAGSASPQQHVPHDQIEGDEVEDSDGAPGEEDTDAADLLVIYELADEVLVVDEYPRYHLARCRWAHHERAERLPVREARQLGFTPCDQCRPDTILARKYRAGRATSTAAAEPGQMQ